MVEILKPKKFVVSIIQNKITNDKSKTILRMKELIDSAVKLYKPELVVLPEFWNCPSGEGAAKAFCEEEQSSESIKFMSSIAREHNIHLIGGSIPIKDPLKENKLFNVSYSFDNLGIIQAQYKKMHLFDVDIPGKVTYYESKTITPGGGEDLLTVFETPFARFGIGICYDIRFYEHAHLLKKIKNIDCLVYPSAFSLPTGQMHWDLLRRIRALDNNVHLITASPSRNWQEPDSYQVYGYSGLVDPYGNIIASLAYDEGIISATIDLQLNKNISEQIPTWKSRRSDLYDVVSKI